MKIKTIYSVIILSLFAFFSCQQIIDIDQSYQKPLIVINGTIQPDLPIKIEVSKSFSYLNTDPLAPFLPEAKADLFINDKWIEEMHLEEVDNHPNKKRKGISYFTAKHQVSVGDKVQIEVSAPGFDKAWAVTHIPYPPSIQAIDTSTVFTADKLFPLYGGYWEDIYQNDYLNIPGATFEPFYRNMRLKIGLIEKNNNQLQHYLIKLTRLSASDDPDREYDQIPLHIYSKDDPAFSNNPKNSIFDVLFETNTYGGTSLFSNLLFKNKAYTLNVVTSGYYTLHVEYKNESGYGIEYVYKDHELRSSEIDISVFALSDELYRKIKVMDGSDYDDDFSFISEPAVTYTNVKNGMGVLGSMSSAGKKIAVAPYPNNKYILPKL